MIVSQEYDSTAENKIQQNFKNRAFFLSFWYGIIIVKDGKPVPYIGECDRLVKIPNNKAGRYTIQP